MIRFYFHPSPEPPQGRSVPGGIGPRLRARSGRHEKGRTARAGVPRHQSKRQGSRHRRHRGPRRQGDAGVRFQRNSPLSRNEDRAVHRQARRLARTAVLALLRRDGDRAVLGPGGAFPARRAREASLRHQPLSARSRATLSRSRRSSDGTRIPGRRRLFHRRHERLGLARSRPSRFARLGRCARGVSEPQALVPNHRQPSGDGAGARGRKGSRLQAGDRRRGAAGALPLELSADRRAGPERATAIEGKQEATPS